MMRIVYIVTGLSVGGAEMMLLKLIEQIDKTRYSVSVVSLTSDGLIGNKIRSLGIDVLILNMTTVSGFISGFSKMRNYLQLVKPDIVHTWLYHADLIGGVAARLCGVDTVCWGIRSANLDPDKTRSSTRVIRRICAYLSRIIPRIIVLNSQSAHSIHESLGYDASKMLVIPNGFDTDRFRPDAGSRIKLRDEIGVPVDTDVVAMVGRYDPLKNHVGFISAMNVVCHSRPETHCIMVGSGVDAENAELVNAIQRLGLSKAVHLLGERTDIANIMSGVDVLVCPSHAEAFPNVIGEAMSCGVVCVATDVGDCAALIGDTGYVVPRGDMTALADTVIKLLKNTRDTRVKLGIKARERIIQSYEIGYVTQQYQATYDRYTYGCGEHEAK